MSKSPSQCDGKPVGTPTDAVPAWKAGVTFGPDQVERDALARKARNRASKPEAKRLRQERNAAGTPEERAARKLEFKRRRNRADQMTRALRNGTRIPNVANYYGVTPDEVLIEVKWLSGHRNRHKARHRSPDAKVYPLLPERNLKQTKGARGFTMTVPGSSVAMCGTAMCYPELYGTIAHQIDRTTGEDSAEILPSERRTSAAASRQDVSSKG